MIKFIDAHTHLQFAAFSNDYREVAGRAMDQGIGFINVGTQKDTSRRAIEIAHEFEDFPVFATVGLHPIHTEKSFHDKEEIGEGDKGFTSRGEDFNRENYRKLALDPKVLAIGECGLDYFRLSSGDESIKRQKNTFLAQLDLAKEVGKPLMLHCRPSRNSMDAYKDIYELIAPEIDSLSGVINHFFVGDVEMAKKFLKLGVYFTFGGVITFARDYDEVIDMIPLDRILLETDAPYIAPVPYRGRRNEPAYVIEVYKKMADLKGVSLEKLSKKIIDNAKEVFEI